MEAGREGGQAVSVVWRVLLQCSPMIAGSKTETAQRSAVQHSAAWHAHQVGHILEGLQADLVLRNNLQCIWSVLLLGAPQELERAGP